MIKSEIIGKYAEKTEDKLILARVMDKLQEVDRKNILSVTHFLNDHQRALAEKLLKYLKNPTHVFYGGSPDASRTVLAFLPDYMEPDQITLEGICPLACLRAKYDTSDMLSHRDFLGGMMGLGVKREFIGDILVNPGSCDIIAMKDIIPFLASNFESAGGVRLKTSVIPLDEINIPIKQHKLIRTTVKSLRLDGLVASGFSISREKASSAIQSGKVFLNHVECAKPNRNVSQGDTISFRGMGKIDLYETGNKTRKDRIAIVIKKYT